MKKGKTLNQDGTEVTETTETETQVGQELTPIELTARALEKGVDADQLGKFMDLQERHEKREGEKAFAAAMAKFSAEVPVIPKSGRATVTMRSGGSYEYKYPKLEIIQRTIRDALKNNGLAYYWTDVNIQDGQLSLACVIVHELGHSEKHPFQIPVDPNLKVNDAQKVANANSYAKRYALCNALPLILDGADNDGADVPAQLTTISIEDATALKERIKAIDGDEAKFCKFLGVKNIIDIPASSLTAAKNFVSAKEGAAKKAAEKEPEGEE